MVDIDKIIKGLEKCLNPNLNCYRDEIDCPYEEQCWLSDGLPSRSLKEDALVLLQEQKEIIKALAFHDGMQSVLLDKKPDVVRCKDCKECYFASNRIQSEQTFACGKHGIDVTQDWFCADGVAKDKENV